jgi:MoxR-like ATPase
MAARKKAGKNKSSRSTRKTTKQSRSSGRKTAKKTTRKTTKKTVRKAPSKRATTRKATKKQTKTVTRKRPTTAKKITKKAVRQSPVTKVIVKEADNEKFDLLLEQMKAMQEHNSMLAKQINEIKNPKETLPSPKGDESKEKIMTRLKDLLSGQKKEEPEASPEETSTEQVTPKEEPTAGEKLKEQENKVFGSAAPKPEEISFIDKKPTPMKTPEKEKEEFQATKTRGLVTMEEAQAYSEKLKELQQEINKVFVGQHDVVEGVIMSLICEAHTLLEGVPGLAKSLLIEVLGKTIGGTTFERIQFLPDILPADIIGGEIFNPKTSEFVTHKGPIFANFVLCDEINRAPPKTHAAVMEAMAEKKINIANEEFILDRPFLILATQNPLENKGTYSLPEAVLDRFMFKVILDYPKRSDELKIITENATTRVNFQKRIKVVITKDELLEMQKKVRTVYLAPKIREYIIDLVEATRGVNKDIQGVKFLKYGAGVRASIYLGIGAKARALMQGRNYVLPDDVYYVVPNIFRHRLALNYRGKAHNISSEKITEEIISKVNPL